MKKNIKQKFIAIILGVMLATAASYVGALSRPATIYTNPPTFIDVGPVAGSPNAQVKNGPLNAVGILMGNYSQGSYSTINSQGRMSVGAGSNNTGGALYINNNNSYVTNSLIGSIRSSSLSWTGGLTFEHPVCADENGKLILCGVNGQRLFGDSGAGGSTEYETFVVPPGVSSITVEVVGGGGAGYGSKNSEGTGFDDGEDSYLIGENISLIARGGTGASTTVDGGKGGEAISNGSVSGLVKVDGDNGDTVSSTINPPNYYSTPISCSGFNYFPIEGGLGNVGGKGGKAGSGNQAMGGTGGPRGPMASYEYNGSPSWTFLTTSACNPIILDNTSDEISYVPTSIKYNRKGGNGGDGANGGGGGGFGGRGGASAIAQQPQFCDDIVSDLSFNCDGGLSVPGGGGGGYVKATIAVTSGQTFHIKVGKGGSPQSNSCTGTNCALKEIGGGAVSGKGGNGYIKITY